MSARKTKGGRVREQEILDAAARIFFERGYASTSIGDIANDVGLLKGSLYHYISSKEELLFRVIFEAHDVSLRATEMKLIGLPAIEAIRRYVFESVLFVCQHRQQSAVFYSEFRQLTGEHLSKILSLRDQNEQLLRTLVRKAQEDRNVRSDIDARLLTYHLIAPITALPNWYRPEGTWSPEHIAQSYANLAIASISADNTSALTS